MIVEEAMLFFRVRFHENEKIDPIIQGIESSIPEQDRFSSPDKHEWHIHNSHRRQFEELVSTYLSQKQLSLF
jgi:hypothetical protein